MKDNFAQGLEMLQQAVKLFDTGPLEYSISKFTQAYTALIERYSPFKVGDRVCLTRAPEINIGKNWGWMCSRHFLVAGAVATVKKVSFMPNRQDETGGYLSFDLEFDDETWIDQHDVKHEVTTAKHTYSFDESFLTHSRTSIEAELEDARKELDSMRERLAEANAKLNRLQHILAN